MLRVLSVGLFIVLATNGVAMLAAPSWWYSAVPGVPATGPFNAHFVRDIGAAYLVSGAGVGWYAMRPALGWSALVAAAAFLDLHALIHIHDAVLSPVCGRELLRDLPGVFIPAILASALALAARVR